MPQFSKKNKIPVLFIIFNRPAVALESFQAIKRYKPERLYIAADGPRSEKEGEQVLCEETRQIILNEINWECNVRKYFRNKNIGCGRCPSEAITWMFNTEEYGAIFEDDCIVSDEFFRLCEELLPMYENDDRIAQIDGFVPNYEKNETSTYHFTGYPEIWGWATWRRAWQNFDFEMKNWKYTRFKVFGRFPFIEACLHFYIWEKMYSSFRKDMKPHIWDYQWSTYIFMQKKLCIEPAVNLVRNIGFGTESTHCSDTDSPLKKIETGNLTFPLIHPKSINWDKTREKKYSRVYVMYFIRLFFRKILKNTFNLEKRN
jgi:hypothetical protein